MVTQFQKNIMKKAVLFLREYKHILEEKRDLAFLAKDRKANQKEVDDINYIINYLEAMIEP